MRLAPRHGRSTSQRRTLGGRERLSHGAGAGPPGRPEKHYRAETQGTGGAEGRGRIPDESRMGDPQRLRKRDTKKQRHRKTWTGGRIKRPLKSPCPCLDSASGLPSSPGGNAWPLPSMLPWLPGRGSRVAASGRRPRTQRSVRGPAGASPASSAAPPPRTLAVAIRPTQDSTLLNVPEGLKEASHIVLGLLLVEHAHEEFSIFWNKIRRCLPGPGEPGCPGAGPG